MKDKLLNIILVLCCIFVIFGIIFFAIKFRFFLIDKRIDKKLIEYNLIEKDK